MTPREKMAEEIANGLTEQWLARFPRIEARGLKDRLLACSLAMFGKKEGFTWDDLDDAEEIARALVEHAHVARRLHQLVNGEHPDMEAKILELLVTAPKGN